MAWCHRHVSWGIPRIWIYYNVSSSRFWRKTTCGIIFYPSWAPCWDDDYFFFCFTHSFSIMTLRCMRSDSLAIVPSVGLTVKPLHQQRVNVLRLEIKDLCEISTPVCFVMHHPASIDIKSQVKSKKFPFLHWLNLQKAAVIFSMEGCFTSSLNLYLQPLLILLGFLFFWQLNSL